MKPLFQILMLATLLTPSSRADGENLRAGLIGADTSHATAFTKGMNAPEALGDLAKITVTTVYPGGSADIPSSADRVVGYTEELRQMGVKIAPSIESLLAEVDVVLLESVDGRPHLEQALPVFKAGKPIYIDKPLAGTLADALIIQKLGDHFDVPWFTSSSLRFSPEILAFRLEHPEIGKVTGCDAWSPCELEPHHPDLFWYGIHGVETLFTIMGPGITTVARTHNDAVDHVTGVWQDGRVGTFRGLRGDSQKGYGALVYGTKGIQRAGDYAGYGPLLDRIATFFQSKKPAVDHAESIEIYAFMEAADESKRQGGKPVNVSEVLAKAEKEAQERFEALIK